MSDGGYKIRNEKEIHFITFAVVECVDVFTRKEYRDILLDSIRYCQKEKGLKLYGWCIMSNHVHLMAYAKDENLSGILRDFKKFTSNKLLKQSNRMKEKAEENGCLEYLKNKEKRTAGTKNTSFGDRTINRKNVIAQSLVCIS